MYNILFLFIIQFLLISSTRHLTVAGSTAEERFILSSLINLFPAKSGSLSTLFFDPQTTKVYAFGGFDGTSPNAIIKSTTVSFSTENSIYQVGSSPVTYSQKTLTSIGSFSIAGSMPQTAYGYAFHTLTINGVGYIYLFGGGSSKIMRAPLSNLIQFTMLQQELPYVYSLGVSFRTEKNIFIMGGSSIVPFSKSVYRASVDTPTNWQRVASFPKVIYGASVFSIGRVIYIVGGGVSVEETYDTIYSCSFDMLDSLTTSNSSSDTMWEKSPTTLPIPVFASAQFISSNYAYVFSGSLGTGMLRASLQNMTVWENVTSFTSPYYAHGISVMSAGNSLLFGGGLPTPTTSTNYGYLMNITAFKNCFGYSIMDTTRVCSGRGHCVGHNNCSCFSGFYGENCQYESSCNGIKASSLSACSGHGNCLTGGNCLCFEGFSGGDCSNFTCGGISVLDTNSTICSGNGNCTLPETCTCKLGFYGTNCNLFNCSDYASNDPKVCSGHGSCVSPNQCNCNQTSGRFGSECEAFQCYGKLFNDTAAVCSGVGQCIAANSCSCLSGYSGLECNTYTCSPYSLVPQCMGRGICTTNFTCLCEDGYFGSSCELFNCWGVFSNESSACSGNGVCSQPDVCECKATKNGYYYGKKCEFFEEVGSVVTSITIGVNNSQFLVDEGLLALMVWNSVGDSTLVSYRVWCSNCSDYPFTSFNNSLLPKMSNNGSEFRIDVSSLKREYSYEFIVQGVFNEYVLSNMISTTIYIPKKEILPSHIFITGIETSNLPKVKAFSKTLFDTPLLLTRISFNYPEGMNYLLNDCVGFTLDNLCQLNYFSTISIFNTTDWKHPITVLENRGSVIARRYKSDVYSVGLNPVLALNITNPLPNLELTDFNYGSEIAFQIDFSILSEKYSFSTNAQSQVSAVITKPATYPSDFLEKVDLSPKEGISVVDMFGVATPQWTVENVNLLPLSYAFGFYNQFVDKSSTDGTPSPSSLFRVTDYSPDPVAKLPLPYLFKSLSRSVWSTTTIQIVLFVKDSQGHEQSLRVATAKVNPLNVEIGYLDAYSKYVLAFDQSALSNTNNTNLILNVISNVNIDISNADSSLKVLNSISSESSLMSDKKVLNQLSNTVNSFFSNTLEQYQKEIDSVGFVQSSLTSEAKLSTISLLANIFGSSSSSITVSQKGSLLVDAEMQQTEALILSFTKIMLKSEIPKVLSTDSDMNSLPYVKFSTSGLNTTFSSFVLAKSSRSLKNSTTKFELETEGGSIQLDLKEIVGKYGGFGVPLGLSLVSYEKNVRNDTFAMKTQMSSVIQELKYFQNAEVVKLADLQNPIALQFDINQPARSSLSTDPKITTTHSELFNQTVSINGTETVELVNITTSIVETPIVSCLYWDEILVSWRDYGCSLDFYNNNTGIAQCSCSHTTKFSTFIQYEKRNKTTITQEGASLFKPNVQLPPDNHDQTFALYMKFTEMFFGLIFSVTSLGVLFLLLVYRKQQPVQSRMTTPFVGMIALLTESILSSIVQKALFVYELKDNNVNTNNNHDTMLSVNIVGNVCMIIVNTLNITAIFSYLIQVLRFQLMKSLYERLKQSRESQSRRMIKSLKFFTCSLLFNTLVTSCLVVNVTVWSIFVLLVRLELISPPLYVRLTSMAYAGAIVTCSIVISIAIIIDIISASRMKEINGINSSRIIQLTNLTIDSTVKGPEDVPSQPRLSLSMERRNLISRILRQDNPLFFRLEMVLFLICFVCCVIQLGSGLIVEEFSKDPNTSNIAQYFSVVQLVFEIIYSGVFLLVFGGFALLILLKFKRKKKIIIQNDELLEQTEMMTTLQDQTGFELYEEFSKKEFSLENLYLFIEIFNNKSIVKGEYLPLLPNFMDRINENFMLNGSSYEVNIPHTAKKHFTELHHYVTSKRSELLSYVSIVSTNDLNAAASVSFRKTNLTTDDKIHQEQELHNNCLSEEEEKDLKARIILCFDSLSQQVKVNMSDTFYRFISTVEYKNYKKNREMMLNVAKQANVMAWQEPNIV